MRLSRALTAIVGLSAVVCACSLATGAAAQDWRLLDPGAGPAATGSAVAIAAPTVRPFVPPGPVVAPFVLPASSAGRDRAIDCLTAAIYYEAATEPRAGQEAVAQVVLNRLRHPAFPKSVCGVVYEGVGTASACQFTFACDGSTSRRPIAALWENARQIADAALSGHVASQIGAATHYHAAYVSPYWRASLTQVGQIGNHIFYRMPGQRGAPAALIGQYNNDESAPPPRASNFASSPARAAPVGERTVEFTVWGLKMATISVKHGRIDVKSPS
jgi:spore germination cell wall hydrolase CwlJ-like protein